MISRPDILLLSDYKHFVRHVNHTTQWFHCDIPSIIAHVQQKCQLLRFKHNDGIRRIITEKHDHFPPKDKRIGRTRARWLLTWKKKLNWRNKRSDDRSRRCMVGQQDAWCNHRAPPRNHNESPGHDSLPSWPGLGFSWSGERCAPYWNNQSGVLMFAMFLFYSSSSFHLIFRICVTDVGCCCPAYIFFFFFHKNHKTSKLYFCIFGTNKLIKHFSSLWM